MYNSKWREKSVVLKHLFHHSTYIIQYHPVLKGTTQDIWHISIRRTHSFINGLVFTHSQKTTGAPLTPPAAAARSSSSWSAGNGRTYLCSWPSRSPAYAAPCGKHSTTQSTCTFPEQTLHSTQEQTQRTSSHPSRGWPGCSSHLLAWVCRLRSRGGFPEPSDRCTGWPLLICAGPKKEESKNILHFVINFVVPC